MKAYHTSPVKIEKINNMGLFDDCLFFSTVPYYGMSNKVEAVYSINLKDEKIINVCDLESDVIIDHISNVLKVSKKDAGLMLVGEIENAGEVTGDYADEWFIQSQRGACAKEMGFDAVEDEDEQGAVLIVPMMGKENLLALEK